MVSLLKFTTAKMQNTAEIIEKKSRFLGTVVPIRSVEDAETALAVIREEHKAANHNCFAYRVGLGVPVERFSDDGEPSGTAGRPILEVIRRQDISNVLVVVTRYFGGVLLGASGLVRAYTEATSQVLRDTPMLTCGRMQTLHVQCDYGMYGKLEHALGQEELVMYNKQFTEHVAFDLIVPEEDAEGRVAQLVDWTNNQVEVERGETEYIGLAPDGSLVRDVWPEEKS